MRPKKSKLIYQCDKCGIQYVLFHGYLSRFVANKFPELLVHAESHECKGT